MTRAQSSNTALVERAQNVGAIELLDDDWKLGLSNTRLPLAPDEKSGGRLILRCRAGGLGERSFRERSSPGLLPFNRTAALGLLQPGREHPEG
jgi:hypothetical protein